MQQFDSTLRKVHQLCENATFTGRPDEATLALNYLKAFEQTLPNGKQVKPVTCLGAIHYYVPDEGLWHKREIEDVISDLMCYNSAHVVKRGVSPTGEYTKQRTKLRITHAYLCGVRSLVFKIKEYDDPTFFKDAPNCIHFNNGAAFITPQGIELKPHDPNYRCRYQMGVDFDANAKCDMWETILQKCFSRHIDGEAAICVLQEFAGACILGKATHYTKAVLLVGQGANGKTTLQWGIESLLPPDCVTHSPPTLWVSDKFAIVGLRHSLLNSVPELVAKKLTEETADKIKSVIDGNPQTCRRLRQDVHSMYPLCGHIMSVNVEPESADSSDGLWRRFIKLPMEYDFRKDPHPLTKAQILDGLTAERAGMLVWALNGAVRLIAQNKYTEVMGSDSTLVDSQIDSDPVRGWLADECNVDGTTWMSTVDLHKAFRASPHGKDSRMSPGQLSSRLRALGFEARQAPPSKGRLRGIIGIALKTRTVTLAADGLPMDLFDTPSVN